MSGVSYKRMLTSAVVEFSMAQLSVHVDGGSRHNERKDMSRFGFGSKPLLHSSEYPADTKCTY